MTQPADQGDTGKIIAGATLGLALIAVETRVRQEVDDDIQAALQGIADVAVVTASTAPASVITGVGLLSLASLSQAITHNLAAARESVAASIQAGYAAAAQVALIKLTADLQHEGYDVPSVLPELGDTIDVILRDVDTMFGHAQTDLQNAIAAAFDGIQGPDAQSARLLAIKQAVTMAGARLANRAAAAAGTAVQQGATDAQQAIYSEFQSRIGIPGLMKRWVVTSITPCGMCAALDGTMVGINAQFDHNATVSEKDYRPVWRNLLAPPRHPNCRCQVELVKT